MDRSPYTLKTKSPFTPKTPRPRGSRTPSISASLKKFGRFSVSGKSVYTAQVVLKTPFHNAECFGNTLPVAITEALTFADRNAVVSVRISDCGYAWLVCGRRLLVWQYKQNITGDGTPSRRAQGSQCFELTLPQSDLAHRAELVSVFISPGNRLPSCIAVSPEGIIRYWPNVSYEGVSIEQNGELQGQECDSLCTLGGKVDGCVLATTTCTVILIQPRLGAGGRHTLFCHTLRTSSGWLGGISKRMSSIFFGSMTTEHSGETRLVRLLSVKQTDEHWHVYVLAGHSLQKWAITHNSAEPEQLVYVAELGRQIRDAFQYTAWDSCGSDPADIDIWLLDVQVLNSSNIMVLAAAVNLQVTHTVQYAIFRLDSTSLEKSSQVEEFLLLKLFEVFLYQEDKKNNHLAYRLLVCDSNVYIYKKGDITIVQPGYDPDHLDFSSINDEILGGSVTNNTAVFFSRMHGLLGIYPTDNLINDLGHTFLDDTPEKFKLRDSPSQQSSMNLTLYNFEPEEFITAQKDTLGQLKSAFIHHMKKQTQFCDEILTTLFPEEGEVKNPIDHMLDKAVCSLSAELLDDIPSGDPRWLNGQSGLGSSSSMQIQHQLQDKQQALNLFYQFLRATDLWERLSALSVKNSIVATLYILADYSELLIVASCLRKLSMTPNKLLQDAIDHVVDKFYDEPKCGLTRQDIFYREVTCIHRGLWGLVEKCSMITTTDIDPIELINIISETNQIILCVFSTVIEFRQQKAGFFTPPTNVTQIPVEYLPWSISTGVEGIYDSLNKQQALTLKYGARITTEGALRANLYDQYVNLVDLMLDAKKCHVESMRGPNIKPSQRAELLLCQYQQERQKLIQPLVDDKEWERAAMLAEKYFDFSILVAICEYTNNPSRLDEYLERFKNEEFAQNVFNWYMREGKQGKLLARCKAASRQTQRATPSSSLNTFLGAHPQLKWLQHAFNRDYEKTSQILRQLAEDEKDLLTRKKTMLSIAKLSHFIAADIGVEDEFVEDINKELDLIHCQEELPDEVLTEFGYATIAQPVLDPVTIAELSVCPENKDATEYDFKMALDLLNYVTDIVKQEDLKLHIWSSAILRDNTMWKSNLDGLESPVEILRHTMFYKLTDLAINLGCKPSEVLPPIEVLLTAPKLEELNQNANFQFLIKVGYEHFYRTHDFGESYHV